jgi:hypothetical protein
VLAYSLLRVAKMQHLMLRHLRRCECLAVGQLRFRCLHSQAISNCEERSAARLTEAESASEPHRDQW